MPRFDFDRDEDSTPLRPQCSDRTGQSWGKFGPWCRLAVRATDIWARAGSLAGPSEPRSRNIYAVGDSLRRLDVAVPFAYIPPHAPETDRA